jgi:murein L,D-transpeptidase YcbB/YkuD
MVDVSELNEVARVAAELAIAAGMTLTSGRRSVAEQAHAMATNVVLNDKWIGETYAANAVSEACQKWVDEHPGHAKDVTECAAGLLEVLHGFSDDERRHLSWHLSGDAFDCEPDGNEDHLKVLHEIVAECHALGGTAKLLTEEGGLTRWHLQIAGGSPPKGRHREPDAAAAPAHSAPSFPGTFQYGICSSDVKTWQDRLVELGHQISEDGDFGPQTEEATKHFQASKGLTDDGIVGENTWVAAWS